MWFVEQHQVTEEFRYAMSFFDRVDMTTGVNFFTQNINSKERFDIFGTAVQLPTRGSMDHTAAAIFSQADIDLMENLTLTLGGRQTWEKKDAKVASKGGTIAPDFSNYVYDVNDDHWWNFFSGHAALKWQPTEDAMLYGSWTRSFRSGGYNLRNSFGVDALYGKERVDAFEAGLKADWFNGRLTTNVAVFFNDFKDLQKTAFNGVNFGISNAADATIAGFELEVTYFPIENLQLDGSVGYIDAEYDRFEGLDVHRDGIFDTDEAEDLEFFQVPEWSAYLGGEYTIPLTWKYGSEVSMRASASFTDKYALNTRNERFQDNYILLDASMSYTFPGENFKLSLFGKNLTDKRYGGAFINVPSLGFASTQSVRPGRAIGISLDFEF